MRWKLLRRRLSTPRVTVRRHLPWPIRWLSGALVLGFSAAIALWAFETGKDLAGLDRSAKAELYDPPRLLIEQHPGHHLLRVFKLDPVRFAQTHGALNPFGAEMQIPYAILFR